MKKIKTYDDIRDIDMDKFIDRTKKLTAEEARKIKSIVDVYGRNNLHRPEDSTLRQNIIRSAIYGNGNNTKFILKAVELSLLFYDERWYSMTRDLDVSTRSFDFDTSEENVIMYDALREKSLEVLVKSKVKSL